MKNWRILVDPYDHISVNREIVGNRLEKFFINFYVEIKKSILNDKIHYNIEFRTNQLDFLTSSVSIRPVNYRNTEFESFDVTIYMRCPEEYCCNENVEIYSVDQLSPTQHLEYGLTAEQINIARKNTIYLSGELSLDGDQIYEQKFKVGPIKIDAWNNSNLDTEIHQSLDEITNRLNTKVKMAEELISKNLLK